MVTRKSRLQRMARMGLFLTIALCFLMPSLLQGASLCATDDHGQTFRLKVTPKFRAGGISSVVGWADNGVDLVLPIHGSAIVNAAGTTVRISLEAVNHINHQRVGIGLDTDRKLNGSGYHENVGTGGSYNYISVTWTAATCPKHTPFDSLQEREETVGSALDM